MPNNLLPEIKNSILKIHKYDSKFQELCNKRKELGLKFDKPLALGFDIQKEQAQYMFKMFCDDTESHSKKIKRYNHEVFVITTTIKQSRPHSSSQVGEVVLEGLYFPDKWTIFNRDTSSPEYLAFAIMQQYSEIAEAYDFFGVLPSTIVVQNLYETASPLLKRFVKGHFNKIVIKDFFTNDAKGKRILSIFKPFGITMDNIKDIYYTDSSLVVKLMKDKVRSISHQQERPFTRSRELSTNNSFKESKAAPGAHSRVVANLSSILNRQEKEFADYITRHKIFYSDKEEEKIIDNKRLTVMTTYLDNPINYKKPLKVFEAAYRPGEWNIFYMDLSHGFLSGIMGRQYTRIANTQGFFGSLPQKITIEDVDPRDTYELKLEILNHQKRFFEKPFFGRRIKFILETFNISMDRVHYLQYKENNKQIIILIECKK